MVVLSVHEVERKEFLREPVVLIHNEWLRGTKCNECTDISVGGRFWYFTFVYILY